MIGNDTIAAISSAVGESARMVVRTSGPRAREIARGMLVGEPGPAGRRGGDGWWSMR